MADGFLYVTAHKNQEPIQNQNFFLPTKKLLSNVPSVTSTNFKSKESPTEK